jgi:hypothetical protein
MKPQWHIFARWIDGRDPNVWAQVRPVPASRSRWPKLLTAEIERNPGKFLAIGIGHWVNRKGLKLETCTIRTFEPPAPVISASGPDLIRAAAKSTASEVTAGRIAEVGR